jgi:hypothetical protein
VKLAISGLLFAIVLSVTFMLVGRQLRSNPNVAVAFTGYTNTTFGLQAAFVLTNKSTIPALIYENYLVQTNRIQKRWHTVSYLAMKERFMLPPGTNLTLYLKAPTNAGICRIAFKVSSHNSKTAETLVLFANATDNLLGSLRGRGQTYSSIHSAPSPAMPFLTNDLILKN